MYVCVYSIVCLTYIILNELIYIQYYMYAIHYYQSKYI